MTIARLENSDGLTDFEDAVTLQEQKREADELDAARLERETLGEERRKREQAEKDAVNPPPTEDELVAGLMPAFDEELDKAGLLEPPSVTPEPERPSDEELRRRGEASIGEAVSNIGEALSPAVRETVGVLRNGLQGLVLDQLPALGTLGQEFIETLYGSEEDMMDFFNVSDEVRGRMRELRGTSVGEAVLVSDLWYRFNPEIGDNDSAVRAFSKFLGGFLLTRGMTARSQLAKGLASAGQRAGDMGKAVAVMAGQPRTAAFAEGAGRVAPQIIDANLAAGLTGFWNTAEDENLVSFMHEMGLDEEYLSFLAYDPEDSVFLNRFRNAVTETGFGLIADPAVELLRAFARGRLTLRKLTESADKLKKSYESTRAVAPEGMITPGDIDWAAEEALGKSRRAKLVATLGDPSSEAPIIHRDRSSSTYGHVSSLLGLEEDIVGEAAESVAGRAAQAPFIDEPLLHFNYARIDTSDDIQRVISDVADGFSDEITEARGGVRHLDDVQREAGNYDPFDLLLETRRTGKIPDLPDAEALAMREFHNSTAATLERLARLYSQNPDDEAAKVAFNKVLTIMRETQRIIAADKARASRRLGAYRIDAGSRGHALVSELDKLGAAADSDRATKYLADLIAKSSIEGNSHHAQLLIHNLDAASRLQRYGMGLKAAIDTVWYFSLLSRFGTTFRNTVGTGSHLGLRLAETQFAWMIGKALGTNATPGGEALAGFVGAMRGFGDALRLRDILRAIDEDPTGVDRALGRMNSDAMTEAFDGGVYKAFRENESSFGIGQAGPEAAGGFSPEIWGYNPESNFGRVMRTIDALMSVPQRALVSTDALFKTAFYRAEGHQIAYRKASSDLDQGLITREQFSQTYERYLSSPEDAVLAQMTRAAQEGTFTQKMNPDSGIGQVLKAASNVKFVGKFIVPFQNTPYNVSWESMRRSPLGIFMPNFWREIATEDPKRVEMAWSRYLMGNLFFLQAIDSVIQNPGFIRVTGEPASPEGKQDALADVAQRKRLKRTDLSIDFKRPGTGTFEQDGFVTVPFNGYEPVVYPLIMASRFVELMEAGALSDEDAETDDLAAGVVIGMAEGILNQPTFTGMYNAIKAMDNPNHDTKGGAAFAENLLVTYAVPGAVSQFTALTDGYYRTAFSTMDKIKARAPGLSNTLPVTHDVWGRPIRKTVPGLAGLLMGSSAFRVISGEDIAPTDAWLESNFAVIKPPSKKSVEFRPGVRVEWERFPREFEDYKVLAGTIDDPQTLPSYIARMQVGADRRPPSGWANPVQGGMLRNLDLLVEGQHPTMQDKWDNMTDGENGTRVAFVRQVVSYYYAAARDELLARPENAELRAAVEVQALDEQLAEPDPFRRRALSLTPVNAPVLTTP